MYKILLCWRYLRTRYIALASVISVTLGVATLIVVNSVMAGFTQEMQGRIHGILSDVIFESVSVDGMQDADWHMAEIKKLVGDDVVGMSPTVHVPAMLSYEVQDKTITRPINLIGIDEATYASVGDFGKYLQHPENRKSLSFNLRDGGYDVLDHQADDPSSLQERKQLERAGWPHRKLMASFRSPAAYARPRQSVRQASTTSPATTHTPVVGFSNETNEVTTANQTDASKSANPFANAPANAAQNIFDPAKEQHPGVILGFALVGYRTHEGSEAFLTVPGDDVRITYPTASLGTKLQPEAATTAFTVVDLYESKMSEYDASFVFVPLRKLQEIRGMINPQTGIGNFTSIQLKLRPGADLNQVRDKLRKHFPQQLYGVYTWKDKQGPLLAAVQMETATLNVLLFMIIAVAGFGILAIFFMIVVEKTKDIGVLKSLGASRSGIMSIFVGYGISLGIVGAGAGLLAGITFVYYINEIADLISRITGQPIFDPAVYYFQSIPTIIQPITVAWVVFGAVLIAIIASILPARRAAKLHPVEALRYS